MNSFQDFEYESDRLVIRPLRISDYEEIRKSFLSRLPAQHKYDHGPEEEKYLTPEWFDWLVTRNNGEAEEDTYYGLFCFDKKSGEQIGKADVTKLLRGDFQWALLGYNIHNNYQDAGYGTELARSAIDICFRNLKFKRVEAHINTDNFRSIRVAEKSEMSFECVRKNFIYERGEWTDNLVYAIVNESLESEPEEFSGIVR